MSQSPSPEPDEQPDPAETPEVAMADQPVRVRRPGWKSPLFSQPPSSDDAPTDAGTAPSPSSPERSDAPREPSGTKTGSSRASSPGDTKVIKQAAQSVVLIASNAAHEFGARDEYAQAAGLYLADEQDIDGISGPVASLAGRRMGGGLGGDNPDVGDLLAMAIALAGYATKQVAKAIAIRRARRQGVALDGLQPQAQPDDDGTEPIPA